MAIKMMNPRLCLVLVLFSLSLLVLPSHSYKPSKQKESPEGELFDCFLTCGQRRPNDQDLSHCEQKCVDRYQDRKRQEGGGGDLSFPQIEEPWQVYERCQSDCDKQQGSKSVEYQCRRTCHDQYEEMTKHRRAGGDCGCGRPDCRAGSGDCSCGHPECRCGDTENHHRPIEERYKECRSGCGRQEQGQERRDCEQKCQRDYEKQKREGGGGDVANRGKEYEYEQGRESRNPYFFESQRFESKFRTEEGHIKVLGRFSKKSELLKGIDNYRLAILEANPNTFVLPYHTDAESIFFVVGGKGTVSFVRENQRRSFNLKQGDVIRVPAGSIIYLINSEDNEKLHVLKLLQPVNTPGKFKDFFGVGGENPESFYRTFSNDILEAAFNTPREKLDRLFGQQKKGAIIKASKEQIRRLSKESESSSRGRSIEEDWRPINLKNQTPLFSNQFGQLFEASPNDHDQLKDLDVAVGFMNIKKGGMIAPYYNSRSTKIAFVVGGSGYFEMACPHLSSQSQRKDAQYEKVRARVSVGDAFVVPAGHPVAIVATGESDLQVASFGINGGFNQKNFLAGKKNVWKEMETEAKALSFGTGAEEVEEIFKRQEESYFVAGPGRREEEDKRHMVASILDFGGF